MNESTFSIKVLGCKVNQYETQAIRELMVRFGFREVSSAIADYIIINTCTVTSQADAKNRKMIRSMAKENPNAKIIVTGCYAVKSEDVAEISAIDGVFQVVSNDDKMKIPLMLSKDREPACGEDLKITGFESHTRAFVKIEDGCSETCTFCKVRLVRGKVKCRRKSEIISEIIGLLDNGHKEIVLTGICIGLWLGENNETLADLMKDVNAIERDFRIRVSSIEPNHVDTRFIEAMASSSRVCRHLHVPLQSGSDKILKLMSRRYTAAGYANIIKNIRARMPLIGVTMDVIVGFPGEAESDFKDTIRLIRDVEPSRLHVFTYSDRKGTAASRLPGKLERGIVKDRVSELIAVGDDLQRKFAQKFIGKEVEVLLESNIRDNALSGYTREYVQFEYSSDTALSGEILHAVPLRIDSCLPVLHA